jgi:hypothetical protein
MVGTSSKNKEMDTLLESVEQFISDEDKIVSLYSTFSTNI